MSITNKVQEHLEFDVDAQHYQADALTGKNAAAAEDDILNYCRKKIVDWFLYWQTNIERFRQDKYFYNVDMWTQELRDVRANKQKSVLQINMLNQFNQKVLGEFVEADYQWSVKSKNPNAPQEERKIKEGYLRTIKYSSDYETVRNAAFKDVLEGGFAGMHIGYEYENSKTFNKKLVIYAKDPLCYFWDVMAMSQDKSDGKLCGYTEWMTVEEFWTQFPNAKSDLSFKQIADYQQFAFQWSESKKIRIAHVWLKEQYEETIVLLSNGESMPKTEAQELLSEQESSMRQIKKKLRSGYPVPPELMKKITIEEERHSVCERIIYYKMIYDEILEYDEWPSDTLPVIFIDGDSIVIDAAQRTRSYCWHAQDTQRWINYLCSAGADALMNSHHCNWLASTENVEGEILNQWLTPLIDRGILVAKRDSAGQMPEYIPPPQISESFNSQIQMAVNNMQMILGQFESGRGEQGNEVSAKAVNARAIYGNITTAPIIKKFFKAEEQVARVCLKLLPAVLDITRPIVIMDKDKKESSVYVNEPYMEDTRNDMSNDDFDVIIEAGMSMQAQRGLAKQEMLQLMQFNPALGTFIEDEFAKNLDVDNAPDIVDRIHKMQMGYPISQIIAEETGMKPPPPPPPPPELMLAQQDMQIKARKQQTDEIKANLEIQKVIADSHQNDSKNIIDLHKLQVQAQTALIKGEAEITKAHLDNHVDLHKHRIDTQTDLQKHYSSLHGAANDKKKKKAAS